MTQPQIVNDKQLIGPLDISDEAWREYDFNGRTYRIAGPKDLYMRAGGTTHRVVDKNGITHCVPAPGVGDCVLRWQSDHKVSF